MGRGKRKRKGPCALVVAAEAVGSGIAEAVSGTSKREKREVVPTRGCRSAEFGRATPARRGPVVATIPRPLLDGGEGKRHVRTEINRKTSRKGPGGAPAPPEPAAQSGVGRRGVARTTARQFSHHLKQVSLL